MADINELLEKTIEMDASDIHLLVGEPPTLRVHGRLRRLEEYGDLSAEDTDRLMRQIATPRALAEMEEVQGADLGFSFGDRARFRVSIFMQKGTAAMSLRLIPFQLLSFEEIGLDKRVQRLLHAERAVPSHRADRQRKDYHACHNG